MNDVDAGLLKPLLPLLRQLREIKGLREARPGVFQLKGAAFLQFRQVDQSLVAELRRPGGTALDRYALDTPSAQRKLVDDAKRRVARSDDE